MAEISYEDLVTGLRSWVRRRGEHEQAAVELLIWQEMWLRRPDFKGACITQHPAGPVTIDWEEARDFIDRGYRQEGQRPLPAASSHNRILDIAVAIGGNQFGLPGLGRAHRRAAAEAFAAACGQHLAPAEEGHSHPDFIPGDPATCHRCALEAGTDG